MLLLLLALYYLHCSCHIIINNIWHID